MSLHATQLTSVSDDSRTATDAQGRTLHNIGNLQLVQGGVYYTDGAYIYGWASSKSQPHVVATPKTSGIPAINWALDTLSVISPQDGSIKKRYTFDRGDYVIYAFINDTNNAYICLHHVDDRLTWQWYNLKTKELVYTETAPYYGYLVDAQCTTEGLMVLYRDGSVKVNGATTHAAPSNYAVLYGVQAMGDAIGVNLNNSEIPSSNASGGAYVIGSIMWDGRIFDSGTYYGYCGIVIRNNTWVHYDFRFGDQSGDNPPVETAQFNLSTNAYALNNNGSISYINDTHSLSIGGYGAGFHRRAFFEGIGDDEYIGVYGGYGLLTSYDGKGFVMIPTGPSGEIGQYVAGWDITSLPEAEQQAMRDYGDAKAEEALTTSPHFWSGGENTGAYRDSYPLNKGYRAVKTGNNQYTISGIYTADNISRNAYVYDLENGQHLILDGAVYKDNTWLTGATNTRLYPMRDIQTLLKNLKEILTALNEEEAGNETP